MASERKRPPAQGVHLMMADLHRAMAAGYITPRDIQPLLNQAKARADEAHAAKLAAQEAARQDYLDALPQVLTTSEAREILKEICPNFDEARYLSNVRHHWMIELTWDPERGIHTLTKEELIRYAKRRGGIKIPV